MGKDQGRGGIGGGGLCWMRSSISGGFAGAGTVTGADGDAGDWLSAVPRRAAFSPTGVTIFGKS
jgi:hypothetical protein